MADKQSTENADIRSLSYEAESETLDFKSQQYPFRGATDEAKSELLKDILSFVNAWRRSTAYIIIGFEESNARPAKVVGISESMDDADLQQFVNGKINRPIRFAYQELNYEGKLIGTVSIPVQPRPVYLLRDYGKLKKDTVYVRRGTSTAIASPSEIAEMGTDKRIDTAPSLNLGFYDEVQQKIVGNRIDLEITKGVLPPQDSIPAFGSDLLPEGYIHLGTEDRNNSEYYREVAAWLEKTSIQIELIFYLRNSSKETIYGIRGSCNLAYGYCISVAERSRSSTFNDYPQHRYHRYTDKDFITISSEIEPKPRSAILIKDVPDKNRWEIHLRADAILPAELMAFEESVMIAPKASGQLDLNFTLLAENSPEPISSKLLVGTKVVEKNISLKELVKFADKHKSDNSY